MINKINDEISDFVPILNKEQEAEIRDLIIKLSKLIIDNAEAKASKSKTKIIKEEFMRLSAPEFVYNAQGIDIGNIKFDKVFEEHYINENLSPTEIETIALNQGGDLLIKRIKQIVRESRKEIKYNLNLVINNAIFSLPILLASKLINSSEDRNHVIEVAISYIIHIINDEPIDSKIILKLENIFLEKKGIELNVGKCKYVLRQTEAKDIEYEEPIGTFAYLQKGILDIIANPPSAILEINTPTKLNSMFIPKDAEKAIHILRLFKVGGVSYTRYSIIRDNIIDFLDSEREPFSFMKEYLGEKYWINESEIPKFSKFFIAMLKEIPESLGDAFRKFNGENRDYIVFAYDRYCESLLRSRSNNRKISEVIIGLESLYSDNDPAQVSYKLRIRVAKIMQYLGKSPIQVFKDIKDAYAERSKFLHGNNSKKLYATDQLLLSIQDYLRISIVFFVLSVKNNKSEFIKYLDNAIVDNNSEIELIKKFGIGLVRDILVE